MEGGGGGGGGGEKEGGGGGGGGGGGEEEEVRWATREKWKKIINGSAQSFKTKQKEFYTLILQVVLIVGVHTLALTKISIVGGGKVLNQLKI